MNSPSPIGVIDIGTNTFHILIVQVTSTGFKTLYKERIYVKLGQGGKNSINESAFKRGLFAMKSFREILDRFNCSNYKCIGTAAMRYSSNAKSFKKEVYESCGITIDIISGIEEANFIFDGIKLAYPMTEEKVLVMDIGGGSVEYILANAEEIFFAKSYPLGMTILKQKFHLDDPMTAEQKDALKNFVLRHFDSLRQAISIHKPKTLIGSSGTFEVLDTVLKGCQPLNKNCTLIQYDEFLNFYTETILSDIERLKAQGLVPIKRIDLISVALQLVKISCTLSGIKRLVCSRFALKEGVLQSMI